MSHRSCRKNVIRKGCLLIIAGIFAGALSLQSFCVLGASEQTEETTSRDGDWTYRLNENDEVVVTGYKGDDTKVVLGQIDEKDVVSIESGAFYNNRTIEEIVLPNTLESVSGFMFCENLKEIVLPEGTEYIGGSTFMGSGIQYAYIPSSVNYIGDLVFNTCESLTTIEVSPENEHYYCESGMLMSYENELLFYFGSDVEVEIPFGCVKIAGEAFKNKYIKKVVIPDTVTDIMYGAFSGCQNLSEIVVGNQIEYIDLNAFRETAYYNDMDNWEDGVLYLGPYALLANDTREHICIKEGTIHIASGFCNGNKNVKSVYIPKEVRYIGIQAFSGTNLRMVKCDAIDLFIGQDAFYAAKALENIYFCTDKIYIDTRAFYGCSSLKNIYIDSKDAFYNLYCFYDCVNVKNFITNTFDTPYTDIFYTNDFPENVVIKNVYQEDIDSFVKKFLVGCTDRNIFLNVSIEDYQENASGSQTESESSVWNQNTVYLKGEYQLCEFYIDGYLQDIDVVKTGESLVAPSDIPTYYHSWENGLIYENIRWDINQDGVADELPNEVYENISAQAVYDVHVHSWDEGVVLEEKDGEEDIWLYTCVSCQEQYTGTISDLPLPTITPVPSVEPEEITAVPSPSITPVEYATEVEEETTVRLNLKAKVNKKGQVILKWNKLDSDVRFKIYRSKKKTKGYKKINAVSGKKYIDKKVRSGEKYFYMVQGVRKKTVIIEEKCEIDVAVLSAPKIRLQKRKNKSSHYIEISLKKYQGNRMEIQYRKGDGKYYKLPLKTNKIRKNKKVRVQYTTTGELLCIRVRTYTKSKKKKLYSKWSEEKQIYA